MSRVSRKNRKNKKRARAQNNGRRPEARAQSPKPAPPPLFSWSEVWPRFALGGALLTCLFFWSYWPTLVELVRAWDREPDYSHGFLVAPLAAVFLWVRRDFCPGFSRQVAWPGLILIGLAVLVRYAGALYYLDAADGWSIPIWVAGVVWLLAGWRALWWALPSVAFLWFMVPLPFRVESWFRLPLQKVATKLSCWSLQFLGQPALAEGNTIFLGDYQLEVAEACSGLRIFMTIAALAFAYVIVVRRAWWQKALLLASILPIALIANSARIVVTGLLYQFVSGEAAQKFSHDFAGWMMIPLAGILFWFVLWYLGKLVYEVHMLDISEVVRKRPAEA